MNNSTLGDKFENEFCELLFKRAFWVHKLARNKVGQQPADVIAVKDGNPYLIDCKVCSRKTFPLSRIEENQHFSMEAWRTSGNGEGWFALKIEDEVIMIPHRTMIALSYEKSTLNEKDIHEYGVPLERWLNSCM